MRLTHLLRALPSAALALALPALLSVSVPALAQNAITPPSPLSRAPRPEPSNLGSYVANRQAAVALGKALFWEQRLGSDGKTACASCHFHAGADTRSRNQLSPPPGRTSFAFAGPNHQFTAADFPFHQFANPDDRNSTVTRSVAAVSGSQGVLRETFSGVVPGQAMDAKQLKFDPVFNVGNNNVRQAAPRNSPSVINAVFNLRNFWDGRAQSIFNGVSPWGKRDPNAFIYRSSLPWNPLNLPNVALPVTALLNDSSLASQAVGPPLSGVEMSAEGRNFPELGRKMLPMRPLALQAVASDDGVLGAMRHSSGRGLSSASYEAMVRAAFRPEWWNANTNVRLNNRSYRQIEANFSLFFGLALQMYQATLVSDQTPFDRYLEGQTNALTALELQGFGVFMNKGKCINCHGGAALTNASIQRMLITGRMSNMRMGNNQFAVYDEGFYNIAVTPTNEDRGVGGNDPWGNPLSFSGVAKKSNLLFNLYELALPNVVVTPLTRIAANGAFKTPGLRNVELTAPYFHNGGALTLEHVVELYNRGGNFASANIADLDADIQPLGLTPAEKAALVAFMKRPLTDQRVLRHAAPFDHPQLTIPNGQVGNRSAVSTDSAGRALDQDLVLPAVGRNGYSNANIPRAFLQ